MVQSADESVRANAVSYGRAAFGEGWSPSRWSVAPGRLELLGNHVDYNGGLVLAGAIDRSIWIAVADGDATGRIIAVAADVEPEPFELTIKPPEEEPQHAGATGPREYMAGVIAAMRARDLDVRTGLEISIAGNVPLGFGMSSSASLCVALINALAIRPIPDRDVVLIAQDAEHRAGSPVGAMDQSASVAGGVILFDGATTTFEHLNPNLGRYIFAVADSGVSHAIGTSSYPIRVEESRKALDLISEHANADIPALGALEPSAWEKIRNQGVVPGLSALLTARVDHVVSEVERVRQGVRAIQDSDWVTFGELMTASGQSSASQYEISHPLVEELVDDLVHMPGVAGARMMGGGEGGPALALIESSAVDAVASSLMMGYYAHHKHARRDSDDPFQVCVFGPGARVIRA